MIDELEKLRCALQIILNQALVNIDVMVRVFLRRVDMPILGVACMMTSQFEGLLPIPNQI
jgi:hypothetical protein